MIFSDFCREVSELPQLCRVLLCNTEFNSGNLTIYFVPGLFYCECGIFAISYPEKGERRLKSTSWSQGKLRRRPRRDIWGQRKCPEALVSADGLYKLVCGDK